MSKERLDNLLVERNLVESRSQAQRLIMAGQVRVDGQMALKASSKFSPDAALEIIHKAQYVSRGGEKLMAALDAFSLDIAGKLCADVGSSTGGFTDCLLQNGAARIYAIDVGKGILHWKLRQDERVVVMEETNARYLKKLPEAVDLVTVDTSFISLKILLPVFRNWFNLDLPQSKAPSESNMGDLIALIKPQFEAGRVEASRGQGVIRDPEVHKQVLVSILEFAQQCGYHVEGLIRSPLSGPKGNIEFLAWMVNFEGEAQVNKSLVHPKRNQTIEKMITAALA